VESRIWGHFLCDDAFEFKELFINPCLQHKKDKSTSKTKDKRKEKGKEKEKAKKEEGLKPPVWKSQTLPPKPGAGTAKALLSSAMDDIFGDMAIKPKPKAVESGAENLMWTCSDSCLSCVLRAA
jgi:hypothetical protein